MQFVKDLAKKTETALHQLQEKIEDATGYSFGNDHAMLESLGDLKIGDEHPIKHMVVICMENRSFDALLGWWAKEQQEKGVQIDGIPEAAKNIDSKTGTVWPAKPNATYVHEFDPDHETFATTQQIYGMASLDSNAPIGTPTMGGFVDQAIDTDRKGLNDNDPKKISDELAAETVMSGFAPSQIPVFVSLAENFGVFDAWHAGIPGPTFPNRVFLASATSNGMSVNNNKEFAEGLPQKSIFQMFHEKKLSFKNYYGQAPTGLIFSDFRKIVEEDILHLNPSAHMGDMSAFKKDCEEGTLPTFSWIDPIFVQAPGFLANDMHPPHDAARGEILIKEIYEALRASPQWEKTALLITFDEHGGYYDHVAPPTNVPSPDEISSNNKEFKFDRVGIRVPAILVSAHINKGAIFHDPAKPAPSDLGNYHASKYDHSSLVHSVNDMFNLDVDLNPRARWSGSFAHKFTKHARKDCPVKLPDAPAITERMEAYDEKSEWTSVFAAIKDLF